MPIRFEHAQQTYVGKTRMGAPNEDAVGVYIGQDSGNASAGVQAVFCVADGMGGGEDGEVASKKVLTEALSIFANGRLTTFATERGIPAHMTAHLLKEALQHLNDDLNRLAAAQAKTMGTTADVMVVRADRYCLGHVGDSRAYLVRDHAITQLTQDHSAVEELVRMNVPRAEALQLFGSNIVTNILGVRATVRVDVVEGEVRPGDCFVLCTDGLTGGVQAADILQTVSASASCQEACDELVRMANDRDGSDNITVLIARAQGT